METREFEFLNLAEAWEAVESWIRVARFVSFEVQGTLNQMKFLVEVDEELVRESESLAGKD